MSQTLPSESMPVPQLAKAGQRIDALDLLRGIAILGIFLMNTWTMSLPQDTYMNPATYNPNWLQYDPAQDLGGGFPARDEAGNILKDAMGRLVGLSQSEPLTGVQHWTYVAIHLFADMKFITTFSILFGAGIVLQAERARRKGNNPWTTHPLRMVVLLMFGLCHTFGFWYGDILTDYAMCGVVLAPFRLLPAWLLFLAGMGMVFVPTGQEIAAVQHRQTVLHAKTADELTAASAGWYKPIDAEHSWESRLWSRSYKDFDEYMKETNDLNTKGWSENDRELTAYHGSWWGEIVGHRFWCSIMDHTTGFMTWTFWRCGGCFLIGMALQKRRFFHGAWNLGAYATIASLTIPAGWTISYIGVMHNQQVGWVESDSFFSVWHLGTLFNYWGSLLCAVGYLSCGVLLAAWAAKASWVSKCLIPIRSIGRMALTCYLTETLIGTTFYYGHEIHGVKLGFGYFGHTWRTDNLYLVFSTWAFLMVFATLWLTFFKQGPLEWFWHSLVYWDWKNPLNAAAGPDASLSTSVQGRSDMGRVVAEVGEDSQETRRLWWLVPWYRREWVVNLLQYFGILFFSYLLFVPLMVVGIWGPRVSRIQWYGIVSVGFVAILLALIIEVTGPVYSRVMTGAGALREWTVKNKVSSMIAMGVYAGVWVFAASWYIKEYGYQLPVWLQ